MNQYSAEYGPCYASVQGRLFIMIEVPQPLPSYPPTLSVPQPLNNFLPTPPPTTVGMPYPPDPMAISMPVQASLSETSLASLDDFNIPHFNNLLPDVFNDWPMTDVPEPLSPPLVLPNPGQRDSITPARSSTE